MVARVGGALVARWWRVGGARVCLFRRVPSFARVHEQSCNRHVDRSQPATDEGKHGNARTPAAARCRSGRRDFRNACSCLAHWETRCEQESTCAAQPLLPGTRSAFVLRIPVCSLPLATCHISADRSQALRRFVLALLRAKGGGGCVCCVCAGVCVVGGGRIATMVGAAERDASACAEHADNIHDLDIGRCTDDAVAHHSSRFTPEAG